MELKAEVFRGEESRSSASSWARSKESTVTTGTESHNYRQRPDRPARKRGAPSGSHDVYSLEACEDTPSRQEKGGHTDADAVEVEADQDMRVSSGRGCETNRPL